MSIIQTLRDVETVEQTPLAARQLPDSTYEAICRSAAAYPDLPALIFFLQGTAYQQSVTFSFRDFLYKLNQTANMLHDLGVGSTDTVSYLLPNLPQTYWALYGAEAVGIANPVNPLLEPETIAEILNAAKTKVLVTLTPFPNSDLWPKVVAIADDVPTLETILQVDIATYLGLFKKLAVGFMRRGQNGAALRARVLDFDKTLARYRGDGLANGRIIQPTDLAAYFHTGGTTGTPKLARHTHFNQVFDSWAAGDMVNSEPGETNFLGLPLFHNYGAIAIGLGAWQRGCGVVMGTPQGYRGEGVINNFWHILSYYRCNMFSGVPTVFKALLNVPIGDADLSALKISTCGAAPLPVELARQFTAMSGVDILEGYGLTEGTSVSSVNPMDGEQRIGSVGYRLPYQEMQTAVLADNQFVRFCEPDEVGVILVRGPNVFAGYTDDFYNQTAFVETGDGNGRWLNTGDMGRQDADGYFWLTGRKKELIIRGGHNIDPQMIEEPMHTHPAVALAAAVGRPDDKLGERPVVYVELKPDAQATSDELVAFAQSAIGERAAVPQQVIILEQIPLTAVGKIYKPALVRQQVAEVYTAEVQQIAGVADVQVVAQGDKKRGTVVQVRVTAVAGTAQAALAQTINGRLGNYTIPYELVID